MKNIITLLILGVALSMNAQTSDSLQTTNKPTQNFNSVFDGYKYSLDLKNTVNAKSKLAFSSYNKTTRLNDFSFIKNDSLVYVKSNVVLENNFRGSKIDSFNPYGVVDVKYGILLGAIKSVLNSKQ
ncbi:hypothetical protein [Nonlabens antarcticus]|uniref:hypothetical protein n=1 Tax=Nonlabens antarcticus TaxID=392714 RepID=UPI001891A16D|nr:hypothetical protein [Nonlabens antarcticus]